MGDCPPTQLERLRAEVEKWKCEAETACQGQEAGSQWNWELKAENQSLFDAFEGFRIRVCNALELEYTSTSDIDIFETIRQLKSKAPTESDTTTAASSYDGPDDPAVKPEAHEKPR